MSSGHASKYSRFEDAPNMENALMQQPSHILNVVVSTVQISQIKLGRVREDGSMFVVM